MARVGLSQSGRPGPAAKAVTNEGPCETRDPSLLSLWLRCLRTARPEHTAGDHRARDPRRRLASGGRAASVWSAAVLPAERTSLRIGHCGGCVDESVHRATFASSGTRDWATPNAPPLPQDAFPCVRKRAEAVNREFPCPAALSKPSEARAAAGVAASAAAASAVAATADRDAARVAALRVGRAVVGRGWSCAGSAARGQNRHRLARGQRVGVRRLV
jgi:hypothetical protein